MAADAADVELMIVGTVKSVGDKSIDAEAPRSVVTTGEGATAQVTDTGLQAKADQPATTGPATTGKMGVDKSGPGEPPVAYVAPVVNAAERAIPAIGKTVDSADDTARLMIVTHYAGTNKVKVYGLGETNTQLTGRLLSDGRIQTAGVTAADETPNAADDTFVTLKSVGMYYRANDNTGNNDTDSTLEALNPTDVNGTTTPAGDTVGALTKPKEVYLVSGTGVDGNAIPENTIYVVRGMSTIDADGNTNAMFTNVAIHVEVDRDGVGDDEMVQDPRSNGLQAHPLRCLGWSRCCQAARRSGSC